MKEISVPFTKIAARRSADILNSWKEIAVFLDRGVRTVQRWESEHHLPVHRVGSRKRSPVFAYPAELLVWTRTVDLEVQPSITASQQPRNGAVGRSKQLISQSTVLVRSLAELMAENQKQTGLIYGTLTALQMIGHRKHIGNSQEPQSPASASFFYRHSR